MALLTEKDEEESDEESDEEEPRRKDPFCEKSSIMDMSIFTPTKGSILLKGEEEVFLPRGNSGKRSVSVPGKISRENLSGKFLRKIMEDEVGQDYNGHVYKYVKPRRRRKDPFYEKSSIIYIYIYKFLTL